MKQFDQKWNHNSFMLEKNVINVLHAHIDQFKFDFKHFGLDKNNIVFLDFNMIDRDKDFL